MPGRTFSRLGGLTPSQGLRRSISSRTAMDMHCLRSRNDLPTVELDRPRPVRPAIQPATAARSSLSRGVPAMGESSLAEWR